ncbi:MAG: Nif3-like dinuclear metal center hexameric protein [Actinomycetota bacterium]|jgi:dinuclear metal center YbgI/SA1388 family protein|nr:Nif3-like dinuclear metal center hexameric protein [Euzebyaceae bacterium]MDQ3453335.1 Nif3-like dinuclear metal center hexameric protein [Actinomycetota bacterium]
MADRLADWLQAVDALYPQNHAASWDSTGLQVGDPDDPVRGVLLCLDVVAATLDEAAARGADLLLAHHPLLFRPLDRLTVATVSGRLALQAARSRIAVLAAHTNFDSAVDGTTEPVVRLLGLGEVTPLAPAAPGDGDCKLVTFVPPEATQRVRSALTAAGAGTIGAYRECSFQVRGTGTFEATAGANPAVGQRGRRNEVVEDRLEMVVPQGRLSAAVAALRHAHPYEEVAYDVLRLLGATDAGRGMGRVGDLAAPLALGTIGQRLAVGLPSPHLRVGGDPHRPIRRVAACGGAGDALIGAALDAGADCYITGDLRHHVALDARSAGMAVIDAGHYATEAAALPLLQQALAQAASRRGLTARLLASAVRTDPWQIHPGGGWDTGLDKGAP